MVHGVGHQQCGAGEAMGTQTHSTVRELRVKAAVPWGGARAGMGTQRRPHCTPCVPERLELAKEKEAAILLWHLSSPDSELTDTLELPGMQGMEPRDCDKG